MSSRKWVFRVRHILQAIERIQQYTAGMDEAGFAGDQKTVDAVVRNFQVIGEAPSAHNDGGAFLLLTLRREPLSLKKVINKDSSLQL